MSDPYFDEETGGYDLQAAFEDDPLAASVPVIQQAAQIAAAQAAAEIQAAQQHQSSLVENTLLATTIENNLAEKYGHDYTRYKDAFVERVTTNPDLLPEGYTDPREFAARVEDQFLLARAEAKVSDDKDYWAGIQDAGKMRWKQTKDANGKWVWVQEYDPDAITRYGS